MTSIFDYDGLLRRIRPEYIVPDESNPGGFKVQSSAFSNTTGTLNMSVCIEKLLPDVIVAIHGYDGYGLKKFTKRFANEIEQEVIPSPTSDTPSHADVTGKKSKAVQRKFAKHSEWIINPLETSQNQ